jgi:T5SS/PEP-CTERM-associated repeat protein
LQQGVGDARTSAGDDSRGCGIARSYIVHARADDQLDGATSSDWFNSGNWTSGVPTASFGTANIDTDLWQQPPGFIAVPDAVTTEFSPGSQGTVTVTGAGSIWNTDGSNIIVGGASGTRGKGTLTVADGGTVSSGPIAIAPGNASIGTPNIGAAPGDPAAAPGALDAPSVTFGPDRGTMAVAVLATPTVHRSAIRPTANPGR